MGFTTPEVFNHPITEQLMRLREELEYLPWYHFIEKFYIRSDIRHLERQAFSIGLEMALNDLVKMGFLEPINPNQ
jgi:hypothetical protein